MVSTVFSFASTVCSFLSTVFIFISYCVYICLGNTDAVQLPKIADGKARHPDWMSQDSPDEQSRPSGEWKNCLSLCCSWRCLHHRGLSCIWTCLNYPVISNQDLKLFHQLFSDEGDEQKTYLTLIRMTKDEKGLAFFKGLLL